MKVILISGWANSASAMTPLAAAMGSCWNAECVDVHTLEEIGRRFPSTAGISDYASGLLHLMEHTSEPCVVGGWSMGGLVAQEAYSVSPAGFAGLMFFGSTSKFCMGDRYAYGTPVKVVNGMKFMLTKTPEKVLSAFYAECAGFAKDPGVWRDLFVDTALALSLDGLKRGLDYLKTSDFRAAATLITCPVIVLHGSRDLVIPVKAGRELA